jgi:hypothetical protein
LQKGVIQAPLVLKKGTHDLRLLEKKQSETLKAMYASGKFSIKHICWRPGREPVHPTQYVRCQKCGSEYLPLTPRQRWCKICVPGKKERTLMMRYGMSAPEYEAMLRLHDGKCWLCRDRLARVVDHHHETGRVRGLLCYRCNLMVSVLEDEALKQKGLEYVSSRK